MSVLRGDGEATHLGQSTLLVNVAPSDSWRKVFLYTVLSSYTQKRCLLPNEFLRAEDNFCFVHLHVKYTGRRKKLAPCEQGHLETRIIPSAQE